MANQLPKIKHIVQLMMENRSFDQMLGFLYAEQKNVSPRGQPYEGLTGKESNPDGAGREVQVYKIGRKSPHPYLMPGADPGEGFYNTNQQLFSMHDVPKGTVATNKGFVINFKSAIAYDTSKHYQDTLPGTDPSEIMGMYPPDMLPVMSGLAKGFAVCDHWFASAPTQTIPNRAFAGAATSLGHLDNAVKIFTCTSIFGQLSKKNIDWAIFGYNRDPMTRMDFPDTKAADESHFGHFADFQERAKAGTLPAYTFLEPSWSANGNSQHPNYDVALGEQLMHEVYYTLRNGPNWADTLLVITYDEHGGNYDHVAPPNTAVAPDNSVGEFDNFDFTRFGVRVPALLISPRIAAGTVFRTAKGTIDHTSVLKTIEVRWNVPSLTARDKAAPDLGDALTLVTARTDDPLKGVLPPVAATSHPNSAQPSKLERVHAQKVAQLPIRNDRGGYDHTPPDLNSSAAIGDYIRDRTAAWNQHLRRQKKRHATGKAAKAAPVKKAAARKKKRPSKRKAK